MMSFDEVMGVPDQEMRSICLNLPVPTLVRALCGARSDVIEKFLANVRPDLAEMAREMIQKQGVLPEADVQAAREKIAGIVEKSRAK
jgi:flagellar motor switch protein FliG